MSTPGNIPPTYRLCGRVVCAPIDGCLAVAELITTVGTVASAIWGTTWAACVFGGAGVVVFGSHVVVRRYGNIAVIVDQFQRAIGRQAETLEGVERDLEAARGLRGAAEEEGRRFAAENQRLGAELAGARAAVEQFRQSNEALAAINQKLQGQITDLARLNQAMKESVKQFGGQLKSLGEGVQGAGAAAAALQGVDPSLRSTIEVLDRRFDEDLEEFHRQIERAKELFASMQRQNEEMERQLAILEREGNDLTADADRLESESGKIGREVEQLRAVQQELAKTERQLEAQVEALRKEREALRKERGE